MPRYAKTPFRLGDYWLSQREGSPFWYRTWRDPNNQVRRRSLRTADLEQTKCRLENWCVRVHRPDGLDPEEEKLLAVLMRYYEYHGQKIASAPSVWVAIKHLYKYLGDIFVSEFTIPRQEAYVVRRRQDGVQDGTISRELSVVRAALNRARLHGEVAAVPLVMTFPRGAPRERVLTKDEMAKLLQESEPHCAAFIMVAANTLGRPEAVLDLTLAQCDFECRLIKLNLPERKKTKKHRPTVPMTATIEPWLLPTKSGYAIEFHGNRLKSIKRAFRRARERAGLDNDVIPYTIRHTMASEFRHRGVPMWDVAGMLGHKIGGPINAYAKYAPDYLGAAVTAKDAYFDAL